MIHIFTFNVIFFENLVEQYGLSGQIFILA